MCTSKTASLQAFATAAYAAVILVIDPLAGRMAMGVAPRHVAFYWPIYCLAIATGSASLKNLYKPTLISIVLVCLGSVTCRWANVWSDAPAPYRHEKIEFVDASQSERAAIVYDGRSKEWMDYCYHGTMPRFESWTLSTKGAKQLSDNYSEVIFLSDDFKEENRIWLTNALDSLLTYYHMEKSNIRYPMFQYLLLQKADSAMQATSGTRAKSLEFPLEIYDLRFKDLVLPVQVEYRHHRQEIVGMCGLPTMAGVDSVHLKIALREVFEGLYLFPNLNGNGNNPNDTIAIVSVEGLAK